MDNAPDGNYLPTGEEALAIRPCSDDPTKLANGNPHPRYIEWIIRYPYAEQHPLSQYLHQEKHLDRLDDGQGYFDRKKVKQVLGANGPKMFLANGPLPSKAKAPLLAELLGGSIDEVTAVVEREREMRRKRQSMLDSCRHLPYKLLAWDQMVAGVPCPGCGRLWLTQSNKLDLCGMERQGLDRMVDGPYDPKEPLEPGARRPVHLFENHIANLLSQGLAARDVRGRLVLTDHGRQAIEDEKHEETTYQALHGECHAGRHGFNGGPSHCLRCCGYPPLSPQQVAELDRLFADTRERAEEQKQKAPETPEEKREREEKAVLKRTRRIKTLEAELAKLRAEEVKGPDA